MASKSAAIGAIVVVVIALIALVALTSGHAAVTAGSVRAPILLTDPPHVPAGTSALVVTYSNVMVHVSGAGAGWISATGSGSVNLLTTVNTSKVIGFANVSANSTINVVRLTITHTTITINGTTYNVTVPNGQLTIPITSGTKINGTTGIMIQVSPRVSAVFNNNATTFVMAPAARAAVVTNVGAAASEGVGANVQIDSNDQEELEQQTANITVTATSLVVNGNVTTLSVTVKNNAQSNATFNGTAALDEIRVFGPESVNVTATAGLNASAMVGIDNEFHGLPVSANTIANFRAGANALATIGLEIEAFRSLEFEISSSGALSVPQLGGDFQDGSYVLGAGQSVTMTFSGVIKNDNGALVVTPKAGQQYTITVEGEEDSTAVTTVTATGH